MYLTCVINLLIVEMNTIVFRYPFPNPVIMVCFDACERGI